MATLRTEQEKREIVARCIELEKSGGDVLAYLAEQHYVTPRATWCNLQRQYLHRQPYEFTTGKPNERRQKKQMNTKQRVLTKEQRAEAARIAIEGGDPRPYIGELGFKVPDSVWHNVKEWYKRNDPEIFKKIPDRIGRVVGRELPKVDLGMPKEPEEKELDGVTYEKLELDAGKNYEVSVAEKVNQTEEPEEPKITKPVNYDGFTVRAVEGQYGSYRYQDINGKQWIDYDDVNYQNDLSMTVDQWRGFIEELKQAARVLGVEL